jgi:hypothetical protein
MVIMGKGNINEVGSCNFCNEGKLNKNGTNLIYPYNKVYLIRGNSIDIRICEKCLKMLKEKAK